MSLPGRLAWRRLLARNQQSVVFLHIPKTGGTSLTHALGAHFPPARRFTDNGNISRSLLARHARDLRSGCFLYGHPEHDTLDGMVAARLVTVLRRPVDHAISNYLYIRREPGLPLHRDAMAWSFSDFLRHHWPVMVFQATSLDVAQSVTGLDTRETFFDRLPRIRALLDRIDFVGCQDRLDELLVVLAASRGRRPTPADRLNTSPRSPGHLATTEAMRAQYEALRQAPDTAPLIAAEQALYDQASRLADGQYAAACGRVG